MSRVPDQFAPLSPEEFAELDDFLKSDRTPPSCLGISAVNGLLTSVVIGPRPIPPALWLQCIWGQGVPQWESHRQAERITSLLVRHLNFNTVMLASQPPRYTPLFYLRKVDDKEVPIVGDWCYGFMSAVQLDREGWRAIQGTDAEKFFAIIGALLRPDQEASRTILDKISEQDRDPVHLVTVSVLEMHRFWLSRRATTPMPSPAHAAGLPIKIGRNDLCPCGSGRKYKQCCGQEAGASA